MFRRFRNGAVDMGDAEFIPTGENEENARGIWIKSKSRQNRRHDLVVYYVHGGDMASCSVHFYLEYLVMLLMALQLQGFENPCIFALDYSNANTKKRGSVGFYHQLTEVANGWNHIVSSVSSNSQNQLPSLYPIQPLLAACGDSNGATLILGLMLHIAVPCPKVSIRCTEKPAMVGLISPVTQYFEAVVGSKSDYLTPKVMMRYSKNLVIEPVDNPLDVYLNPGRCASGEWWASAFEGTFGAYFSYGQNEMLAPQIRRFTTLLNTCCRLKAEAEKGQVHAWPVVMAYVGQSTDVRETGVEVLAQNLAQILLWQVVSREHL